jgi:excinuclease ABC subunit C
LDQAPLRIECYDISNLGATDKVGSMVVFEDGLPKRQDYRKFKITGVQGQDDFASMYEMLHRRFTRLLEEQARPPEERRRRFSYPPALVVVDGGRGQLTQASAVLAELGLSIPHIGLAKRLEEVYFPDRPDPLVIRRARGVVRAAAHPRRGAPHRRRLPPGRSSARPLAAGRHPGIGPRGRRPSRGSAPHEAGAASVEEIAARRGGAADGGDRARPSTRRRWAGERPTVRTR